MGNTPPSASENQNHQRTFGIVRIVGMIMENRTNAPFSRAIKTKVTEMHFPISQGAAGDADI